MYYSRSIDSRLLEWKQSANHKPLLLRGARQVGKSSAVRHLALSFEHYIEVNFEKQPELKNLFSNLNDVKHLAMQLGLIFNTPVVPGKTLLFLDEIQASKDAIKSLWFFKEDYPELHVVAAGSLLEFTLNELSSFGVGRVRSLFMYPFSFDEFLNAQGLSSWVEAKRKATAKEPLSEILHNKLVEQFRTFLIVGGMPASVATWIETHNYLQCETEQDDIQQSYYDDFSKYSSRIEPNLLRNTLLSVALQIGRRFVHNRVEGEYRSREIDNALLMLCNAGIIKRVNHTAANGLPLGAEMNPKFRKYIYIDSGLLLRMLNIELNSTEYTRQVLISTTQELVNKGSLTEMALGLELIKYSGTQSMQELYYWENLAKGTTSEVDYITIKNAAILPIECKSGTSGKMKSLRLFMTQKHICEAIRCSLENFGELTVTGDNPSPQHISIIPLYAISNLFY